MLAFDNYLPIASSITMVTRSVNNSMSCCSFSWTILTPSHKLHWLNVLQHSSWPRVRSTSIALALYQGIWKCIHNFFVRQPFEENLISISYRFRLTFISLFLAPLISFSILVRSSMITWTEWTISAGSFVFIFTISSSSFSTLVFIFEIVKSSLPAHLLQFLQNPCNSWLIHDWPLCFCRYTYLIVLVLLRLFVYLCIHYYQIYGE